MHPPLPTVPRDRQVLAPVWSFEMISFVRDSVHIEMVLRCLFVASGLDVKELVIDSLLI
jgi:hypothetical protein